MAENNAVLEQNRFVMNPDTKDGIRRLDSTFLNLKQQFPYLSGLGFFGSRTKGVEKTESDYDVCIFYDSSKMDPQLGTRSQWNNIIEELETNLGNRLDTKVDKPGDGLRIDISKEATDNQLEIFLESAEPFVNSITYDATLVENTGNPSTQNLYFRFFLTIGEEVYKNRKYILERLKSIPNVINIFKFSWKIWHGLNGKTMILKSHKHRDMVNIQKLLQMRRDTS